MDVAAIGPLARLAGAEPDGAGLRPRDLDRLLEHGARTGLVDAQEQRFIAGILDLSRKPVKQVMTPRTRMVSITLNDDPDTIARAFADSSLTRLPVRGDDMDDMVVGLWWRSCGGVTV